MYPIPNNVDWSATAAWIALVVSIIGTIAGPIITTILTNRHQLNLRNLDIKERMLSQKELDIKECISSIGACVAFPTTETICLCGKNFHKVYPYISMEQWPTLDVFYKALVDEDIDTLNTLCPNIIHLLASLLLSNESSL